MKKNDRLAFSLIVGILSLLVGVFNLLRSFTPEALLLCVAFGVAVIILLEAYKILG
jgi:uncharacterized membrane protein